MAEQIIFSILAIVIALFSILAVTSKRIIRSAIYLLFVLLATAGLFLMLDYQFLFAVQITVYAGGIMVLLIMAIFLTHRPDHEEGKTKRLRITSSAFLVLAGVMVCGYIVVSSVTRIYDYVQQYEVKMQDIGLAMLGSEKYQFLLPFETVSVLLLACIVGAIMIARKENNVESNDNKDLDN